MKNQQLITIISFLLSLFSVILSVEKKRAIIFGIDGLLTKCLNTTHYPGFKWMVDQGSYTFKARTSMYSISAPGWSSMLCAQGSEETGITDNDWWAPWVYKKPYKVTPVSGNDNPIPCIFQTLKSNNAAIQTAAYFTWDWFLNFGNSAIPNSIDQEYLCINNDQAAAVICDQQAFNKTIEIIFNKTFDFYFIDFNSLDATGHAFNFCGEAYVGVIGTMDFYLSRVIEALQKAGIYEDTYLIVTSDHGASFNTTFHGVAKNDENLFVPWMIVGPNVRKGYEIRGNVKNEDTSPTIMHALGLKQHPGWRARPVKEIFEEKSFLSSDDE